MGLPSNPDAGGSSSAALPAIPGRLVGLACALAALAAAAALSLAIGSVSIPLERVWEALFGSAAGDEATTIRDVRLPRTAVAIAVGAALGCAGAILQGLTRNPLADPWILGIESGAGFAVALAIFALGAGSAGSYAWFAVGGALASWIVVYGLAGGGGRRATPASLTLAGAAVGALCIALTSAVLMSDARTLDEFRFWVVGSVSDRRFDALVDVLPLLAIGLALALACARQLNGLALGDDVARSLGLRVGVARAAAASAVVCLAGAAVAVAGPIGFVGLAVPHAARLLVGSDYRWVIPVSALCGAILVLCADVIGRVVVSPSELQTGIVMALIGAPVFIALVRRRRLVAL